MNNRKTIFFPINGSGLARNFLLSDFMDVLSQKYRVIILSPIYDDPEFCKKFSDFDIEPLYVRPLTPFKKKLEQIFISIHRALIYNESSEVFSGFGRGLNIKGDLLASGELVRYKKARIFLAKNIFGKLLAWDIVRKFFKWIDKVIFPCTLYDSLIDIYNPSLVFVTSLGSDDQIALLRNCKAHGMASVGMAASWDNLSKWGLREKVDCLAVWSEYMKDEAIRFQIYTPEEIQIVGILQFDHYFESSVSTREDFFEKFGLDPQKKIIFFGSEGPICPDDVYIVSYLKQKIMDGTLAGYQLLVRPHFGYKVDLARFESIVDNKVVFVDNFYDTSNFKDGGALSFKSAINLMVEIVHCDAHVTSTSTLILDIAANGKQPILYYFDKDKSKLFKESVRRFYGTMWMREILKFKLDNIAENEDELIQKIKEIANNPNKDLDKRKKLLERLCYRIDGKSGARLFSVIDTCIVERAQ